MRRMKEMSALQGGMASFYGEMPDSFNLVVNTAHPVVEKLLADEEAACGTEVAPLNSEIALTESEKQTLKDGQKGKKDEEIPSEEKAKIEELDKKVSELTDKKKTILKAYAAQNSKVRQLVDLALLANNQLKGEALANFVKRSVELL